METKSNSNTDLPSPKPVQNEGFTSEDDAILTTELQDSTSLLAKNKLKELNDILQDYSGFDQATIANDVTQEVIVEDATANRKTSTKNFSYDEENSSNKTKTLNETCDVVPVQYSTVENKSSQQTGSHPQGDLGDETNRPTTVTGITSHIVTDSDTSDLNFEHDASIITFPNNETCDLRDAENLEKSVRLFQEFFQSYKKMKNALSEKDQGITKMTSRAKELQDKNQNLNGRLQGLIQDLTKTQETLKEHDARARTVINRLQQESDGLIKSLKTKCTSMQKDKDAAVMNYARREKELLDAKRVAEAADKRFKEAAREKERAIVQMKGMKVDMVKMKSALERQEVENGKIVKEIDKWKEEANSHVIKVKWAQNKLKSENDSHNETKEKLAKAVQEIKRTKEEAVTIRANCQGMIKTYQESEEMRSNSLDSQLKKKELILSQQEAKSGELEGIHKQQMDELRRLKQQYKDVMEESAVTKTRVDCLEKERLKNEETLRGYTEILNQQKKEAILASEKLQELDRMKTVIEEKEQEIGKIQEKLEQETEDIEEMKINEQAWKKKQQELLEFTQKVSTKNAELASGNEIFAQKLDKTSKDLEEAKILSLSLENELKTVRSRMDTQSQSSKDTASDLSKRLEDKEAIVNHLTTQVEEFKDEIRTSKRKHNSSIKDLTRQLHHARKRLEPYESASFPTGSGPTTENGSMGSRASSDTSIDCAGRGSNGNNAAQFSHNSASEFGSLCSNPNGTDVPETVVASTGEISTQALIERIVRLQRVHARKNEKIDFLHDHVQQLVDEMQKKNKIIQHYILREQSGLLMPETALSHAASGEHGRGKLSQHLTEEVNKKMQSVFEDTLMKNIALKESMDALGSEIARLSASKR